MQLSSVTDDFKNERRTLILAAGLAAVHLATTASAWHAWGASYLVVMLANIVLALGVIILLGTVVLSLLGLIIPRARRVSKRGLGTALIALAVLTIEVLLYGGMREMGIRGVVARGDEIVTAIGRFQKAHGRVPGTLDELVPTYLPQLPSTGAAICPEFWFSSDGRRYSLTVGVAQWPLDFTVLGYDSEQNYDEGDIRYGAWALHPD